MDFEVSTHVRDDAGHEWALPQSRDDVVRLVARLLDEDPAEIDPDENLVECGIDSIGVMRIVDSWSRQGLGVKYADLFERPTATDWWQLLSGRTVEVRETGRAAEVDVSAPFELSPIQHAYWVGRGDDQPLGGVGCHVYLEVDGNSVDPDRLELAVFAVAERHPMLRMRVLGDGTQQLGDRPQWPGLHVHDLRESVDVTGALVAVRDELSHRKLDVERGEVFDVRLSLLPGGATRLHVELDLLVADVLSFNVFLNDLALAYREGPVALRPLTYSYPHYCAEIAERRADEVERDRQYWAERSAGLPSAPQLPLTAEPERFGPPRFHRIARWIEPARYQRLLDRAREERVTVAMTLATAFAEVLGRWSGMSRLLLNVPVFDRKALHPDVSELIADFTNLVLLEVDLGAAGFADRVRDTQRRFQSDISHIAHSGLDVLRELARGGEHSGAPVVFAANLNSGDLLGPDFRDSFGELGFMVSQTPQVWLDHQLMEMDGGLYLNWDYVEDLFPDGAVPAMFEAYLDVLDQLIDDGWSAAARLPLPEGQAAVRAVVGTPTRVESGRVLHGGFFDQAVREPGRAALVWGEDGELSYGELAEQALRVAGELVARGVRPGDAVAVSMPKGPGQIGAFLGVLAAGGVYVPCGVDQPLVRRERMLAAADVRTVVAENVSTAWPDGVEVVHLGELSAEPLAEPVEVSVEASAYVIFTSGSTGVPKGVEVSHRAAVNTVEDINERFAVGPEDRVLAVSAADFDLSVYDMFGLLGAGGAVVLIDESERREARRWVELCRRHQVTVWNSVPALFDMYLTVAEAEGAGDDIRLVLVSGDWVGLDLPGRFRSRRAGGRFVALGGATEAAIWSNAFEVGSVDPAWRSIPYGFALRNQCYRVVDPAGRDCPDWVPGELWIGGIGVAKGYRGDAEKTAEKFVWWEGQRWYRTGDLGRFWPDGTLEFLGRSDHQVKVRGHRIELGEIESVLEGHPDVEHAVATTIGTGPHRKLATAITGPADLDPEAVQQWLGDRLPAHMVPEQLSVVGELPLTPNGKVDRAAVAAELARADELREREAAPPQGPMEELVAEHWLEFLPIERVARTDNFFRCGGDSLIGTRLIARLGSAGIEGAELRGLFANPTLAEFAATLEFGATSTVRFAPDPAARHDPFPVTDVQRAYLLGRRPEFTLGGIGCHFYVEFDRDDLDLDRLAQAWNTLIARHDMLRVVFDQTGHQRVLETVPEFAIPLTEVAGSESEPALARLREEMSHRVFDPGQWPLFDVRAVRYGERVRVGVGLDNLVLDALSVLNLFTELERLHDDPDTGLRPVGVTFRDYQLNNRPQADEVAAAQEYWSGRLDRLPPAPDLPLAADPAHITSPRFLRRQLHLDRENWSVIAQRAREHEITPSALLLACYAEVLGAWTGRPDMTLTLTTFRRDDVHPDIDNILGDFTSLLLVAYEPEPGAGLVERARALQERMWRDLDHQAVSATWVLREMARRAGVAETSMPVVFTSALGVVDGLDSTSAADFSWGITQTPQVWLDHQVREYADGLAVNWDFVDGLFPDGVIDEMFAAYRQVLEWLATGDWSGPLALPVPHRDTVPEPRVESERLLHGGFFDQAVREPGRAALVWGERGELSYGELAEQALRVAGELAARGVRPGDAVAVSMPKGPGQIGAILGVLAAGGVYVPCGVDQPLGRRERMLAAADVRTVVAQDVSGTWPAGVEVVALDALTAPPLTAPVEVSVEASAYVIFTSGSTGVPKGVEVSHRAAVNTIEDINERFDVGAGDRVLAVSAADFDLSVYDMFGLLGVGGAVVLIDESERREARRWVELCRRHQVTVWNSVPALFDMYLTVAEGLDDDIRLVLVSGDWVGLDLPGRFHSRRRGGRFVALGGATEAAIWSNAFEVESVQRDWRSIPYGFALRNQCYRVVDPAGRDCPDWVPGELWIGGVGVAKGYRGDAEKTAEKFVSWEGQRWYRTGDLGRFWPDGTLEFLGRSDHQVKVRGHRIELGEIESVLEGHPHVEHAVATTIGTGPHRKLATAITTTHQGATPATGGMADLDLPHDDTPIEAAAGREAETAIVEFRIAALIAAGIGAQPASPDHIAAALGIDESFQDLLRLWLDWLAERAVLTSRAGGYSTGERWAEVRDPRTWAAAVAAAEDTPLLAVAERLAAAEGEITEMLRGQRSPLTLLEDPVLSPEALVTAQPDVQAAIDRIGRTITELAAGLGRPVRVADLGCRTGMAAHRLLTGLDDHVEATLLDTSALLLESASRRFEGGTRTPRLRATGDAAVPPDLRHEFDVVVMVGALHRYDDPAGGAAQAAELLAPRGVLIGVEHRELAPVALLTAALLERGFGGSQRGPMLGADGWSEVLASADLCEIEVAEHDSALLLLTARSAADRPVVREDEVLAGLRSELPAHMVPERLLVLPRLPLSANGKVDRKRVAELLAETGGGEDTGEPPRTDVERAIAQLWGELLSATAIGRGANFFALGGDSLTATRFAESLLARFGVELPLRQMFADPTVAAIADAVAAQLDDSMEDGTL